MQRTVVSLDAIAGRSAPERLRPPGKAAGGAACASACGSASPSGKQIPADVQAKIAEHPCYSADAHHYFARMHVAVAPACNIQCHYCNRKYDCANESRPGVVSKRLDAGAGGGQGSGRGRGDAAAVGGRHRRPRRRPGQPPRHLRDVRGDRRGASRHQALPVHQRPRPAGSRRRDQEARHLPRDRHPERHRPGRRRADLPVGVLRAQALDRTGGGRDPSRPPARGHRRAGRRRRPGQDQLGADPRHQRRPPPRGERRGPPLGRVPAQHHAADLRSGARDPLRAHRSAWPGSGGTEGAAGSARRRRLVDEALPPVPGGRRGPARRGSKRRVRRRRRCGAAAGGRSGEATGLPPAGRPRTCRPRRRQRRGLGVISPLPRTPRACWSPSAPAAAAG